MNRAAENRTFQSSDGIEEPKRARHGNDLFTWAQSETDLFPRVVSKAALTLLAAMSACVKLDHSQCGTPNICGPLRNVNRGPYGPSALVSLSCVGTAPKDSGSFQLNPLHETSPSNAYSLPTTQPSCAPNYAPRLYVDASYSIHVCMSTC